MVHLSSLEISRRLMGAEKCCSAYIAMKTIKRGSPRKVTINRNRDMLLDPSPGAILEGLSQPGSFTALAAKCPNAAVPFQGGSERGGTRNAGPAQSGVNLFQRYDFLEPRSIKGCFVNVREFLKILCAHECSFRFFRKHAPQPVTTMFINEPEPR